MTAHDPAPHGAWLKAAEDNVSKIYLVERVSGVVVLDGCASGEPWSRLKALALDSFPWHSSGQKQMTHVKACYDGNSLHVLFDCEDRHISASRTALNSDVCNDSCVEFFASLPEDPGNYFNFEINCCGTLHLGYGRGREGRRLVDESLASQIKIYHSVPGPAKDESPDDGWVIQAALPFGMLAEFAGCPLIVQPGTRWRANFYRCGGVTDPQYACWSPVVTPSPDYHRPEYFGVLAFG